MSRTGVLVEPERDIPVPPGASIELWVEWPAGPENARRWLVVRGSIVRQEAPRFAVEIKHYDFRSFPFYLDPQRA